MKQITVQRAIGLSAAMLLASTLIGCAGQGKNIKEWRSAAEKRWLAMRSSVTLQMAQQAFDTGDLDKAEKDLDGAINMDPENGKLYVLAGRIALERGKLERAFLQFNLAIELDDQDKPSNAEAHYYQGIVLQRWQRYENALIRYEKAYEIQPDHPPYLTARCEMLVALDRTDEAISLLESKLSYFDQSAGIRASLAHMHNLKLDFAQAADYFHQASLLDPDQVGLREEHARALFAAGDHEEAVKRFEVLVRDPELQDRPDLRRLLAQSYLKAGRLADARRVYTELTRGGGGDAEDWVQLAQIAWRSGDVGATLAAANRIIRMAPQRPEGFLLAGMAWQKRGRFDDALRNFDRAAQLAPDNAEPVILRGIALQKLGRKTAAADAYAEALRRQPDDRRAARLLRGVATTRTAQHPDAY